MLMHITLRLFSGSSPKSKKSFESTSAYYDKTSLQKSSLDNSQNGKE